MCPSNKGHNLQTWVPTTMSHIRHLQKSLHLRHHSNIFEMGQRSHDTVLWMQVGGVRLSFILFIQKFVSFTQRQPLGLGLSGPSVPSSHQPIELYWSQSPQERAGPHPAPVRSPGVAGTERWDRIRRHSTGSTASSKPLRTAAVRTATV